MGCVSSKTKKQFSIKSGHEDNININMDSPHASVKSDFLKADPSNRGLGNQKIKIQFKFKK